MSRHSTCLLCCWKSNSRKLARWAKCIHLGVGQVHTLGCGPSGFRMHFKFKWINGLLAGSKQISEHTSSISKDSQLVANYNDLPLFHSNKMASFPCNGGHSCKIEVNSVRPE